MTVDVRYVATRGVKLFSTVQANQVNFINNGLKEAFDSARMGGESALLDQLLSPVTAPGQTGADYLRRMTESDVRSELGGGDYVNIALTLSETNGNLPGQPGERGRVLRASGLPANFILANPQFDDVRIATNINGSTYHALQTQFTLRPTYGINYQGTFTYSRSMASPSQGFHLNGANRDLDVGVQFQHRQWDFRSNGTFQLPIGPNKPFFGNASGWAARLMEEWQLSLIWQMTSGRPNQIEARNRLFGGASAPDISPEGVAYFGNYLGQSTDDGAVFWPDGAGAGNYFGDMEFVRVPDPQCQVASDVPGSAGFGQSVRFRCENSFFESLQALARPIGDVGQTGVSPDEIILPDGRPGVLVFQNPYPATLGNAGGYTIEGPGLWILDAALSKRFQFGENRSVQVRFDAHNILNHPTPDDPELPWCFGLGSNMNLNVSDNFGQIGGKCAEETSAREFQASLRIDF